MNNKVLRTFCNRYLEKLQDIAYNKCQLKYVAIFIPFL